jgi:hypothetical protein
LIADSPYASSVVNSHNVTTTNNNITNNNNNVHHHHHHHHNITINNFGQEDDSYVSDEVMKTCVDSMNVIELVYEIYFHPDHPENHTIRLKSEKKGRVRLRVDGKWVEGDMNSSIDNVIEKQNVKLAQYFYKNVMPDESIDFERRAYAQEKLVKANNRNSKFYDQRRQVRAKLKDDADARADDGSSGVM